ncbi:hypothetical protein BT96DRAFT_922970 [Gymnopus androsaceus JB14]|uniref:F-box domain-containing protein n=1 Tax=Gymnopus androsaceus JB14 TaxID=1447944 RepID=A0A6A4HD59_9AGAR|nr:hypothetical protein BT96DRAFT_922970 [Gymnopus androsaceus JB14]
MMDVSLSYLDSSLISDFSSFSQDHSSVCINTLDAGSYIIEPLPSSVNELLNTNEAPLHSKPLQCSLREAETVVSDLNQHLAKMQAEVAQCTLKRDQAVSIVQSYRNILHPLRRTPPEVLLEIFSYCVDFVDTEHPEACQKLDSLDTKREPWNLGQVCKYWRSVVLECPRLWSSLSLNLLTKPPNSAQAKKSDSASAVVLLSHYLRRSKDCALTIAIFTSQPTHPLLSLLCGHSNRWSDMLLSLPTAGFQSLSIINGCLPSLRALHLRSLDSEITWASTPVIDAFEYAPKLVLLRAHEIPNITSQFLLPWDQITYCSNHFPNGEVVARNEINRSNMDMLSKTTRLRHATLLCSGHGPSLPLAPLKHEFLTCITLELIRRSSLDLLDQFLDALTLPSLRSLRMTVSSRHRPRPSVQPIVRLLERSKCSLIKMRLKGFETDVSPDVAGSPSTFRVLLTSKAIRDSLQVICLAYFPNSLLQALTVGGTETPAPVLLPRLKHLRVSGACPVELDQTLFVSMVESRVKYTKFGSLVTSSQFVLTNQEAKKRLDELDTKYP